MAKKATPPTSGPKLAKWQANPGLRSLLPDSALSPAQLKLRQAIHESRQPITPGSSVTNADLAHQAAAATQVRYGPQEQAIRAATQAAQAQRQNTNDYFAQYQAALTQHQANIAQIQQQGQQQARVADTTSNPGSVTNQQAAAVRDQLLASFSGLANQTATNENTYADTLANVVAPGQRLTGMQSQDRNIGAVRQQLLDLADQKGAYNTNFRDTAIQDEAKNVLAAQVAGVNAQTDQANVKIKAATAESTAASRAAAQAETVRHNQAQEANTAASIAARAKSGTKDTKKAAWGTPAQQGDAQDTIGSAQNIAQQLKANGIGRQRAAQVLLSGRKAQPVYDVKSNKKVLNADGTPKMTRAVDSYDQLYASIALDMAYDGHISSANVRKLHARGIKVSALGLPTHAAPAKPAPKATKPKASPWPLSIGNVITGGR